jgi:hypothetical protein
MPDYLLDGEGSGYRAGVDSYHQLKTVATIVPHISLHSVEDSAAFVCNLHHTSQGAGTTENVGYITHDGDENLMVSHIVFTTEEANDKYTKFGIWRNPTTLSGGTAAESMCLNFASNNAADVTEIDSDDGVSVVTIAGGNSIGTVRLEGPTTFDYDYRDAIVLGRSDTIAIKCTCESAGVKVRVSVFFFECTERG